MKPISIVGPYRFHNFGDDLIGAILASYSKSQHGVRAYVPGLGKSNVHWLGAVYTSSWAASVRRSSGVVIGGGGILGDSGRVPDDQYLRQAFLAAVLARFFDKSVVVTAVGAGPLQRERSRWLCRNLCALVDRIGVRDPESREFLASLGVDSAKIVVGADVAMLWPTILPVTPRPNSMVGVQCDVDGFAPAGTNGQKALLYSKLSAFCDASPRETVLVSNASSDTSLSRHLRSLLPSLRYDSLDTFLPHLAGLRAIVTTHLHLAIAAFAARVPCFSIYVREKTARFYRQIGHPERAVPFEAVQAEHLESILAAASNTGWSPEDEARRAELCGQSQLLLEVLDTALKLPDVQRKDG